MASKNAERLKQYKARMRAAGFKRLSFWVCADLAATLAAQRQPSECGGRTLERLLLGVAVNRPEYWTESEQAVRTHRDSHDPHTRARECGKDTPADSG